MFVRCLAIAAIPPLYRDLYSKCSHNDAPVHKDIYQTFLSSCQLSANDLRVIWDMVGLHNQGVNRTNFYKTLALVAWAQQGKEISEKMFDNFTGDEYPCPKVGDLAAVLSLKRNLFEETIVSGAFQKLLEIDSVVVQLVPEKKGLFLKYSEYLVHSKRYASKVTRRYTDFVALQELLMNRFPYRLVPSLPPKKIMMTDSHFLEERSRGLQRWLTLVCRHPIMCHDSIITFFLTDTGSDLQTRIRNSFRKVPDEFMTSDLAANAKELLPNDSIASSRETIRSLVGIIGKLKQDADSLVQQTQLSVASLQDMSGQLELISGMSLNIEGNFSLMSKELGNIALTTSKQSAIEQKTVCEKLSLLYDILVAHKGLCERLERGLAHDHQVALSKMLALKKKKLQGAIRGIDAESVEQLEAKMLAQENIISSIDLRTDFSLYCVYMETQLVYAYLGMLPKVMEGLVGLKARTHFELLDLWRNLQSLYSAEPSTPNGLTISK